MMRLYDHADVIRSKNAGPFTLTIDLIFNDEKQFSAILNSPSFNEKAIALLYNVPEQAVKIHSLKQVYAIKVTLPRVFGSCGGPGDRDVYGCQQHFPLADMEIQLWVFSVEEKPAKRLKNRIGEELLMNAGGSGGFVAIFAHGK